jgi:hypothetical protein
MTGLLFATFAAIAFLIAVICYFKLFFGPAHRSEEDGFDFLLSFKNRGNELRTLIIFWLAVVVCSTFSWYFTVYLQPNGKGFKSATSTKQKIVSCIWTPKLRKLG